MSDYTVRRYDMVDDGGCPVMMPIFNGEYVTYDEHKAIVAALRTQAQELAQAQAQAVEWERKLREICQTHGDLLLAHHDLTKQALALAAAVAKSRYDCWTGTAVYHDDQTEYASIHAYLMKHDGLYQQAQALLGTQGRKR